LADLADRGFPSNQDIPSPRLPTLGPSLVRPSIGEDETHGSEFAVPNIAGADDGMSVSANRWRPVLAINHRIARLLRWYYVPALRKYPKWRVLELLGVAGWVAELSVIVDAASEEVFQEPLLHLLQLGDKLFGLYDRLVQRVENLGDAPLLGEHWQANINRKKVGDTDVEEPVVPNALLGNQGNVIVEQPGCTIML